MPLEVYREMGICIAYRGGIATVLLPFFFLRSRIQGLLYATETQHEVEVEEVRRRRKASHAVSRQLGRSSNRSEPAAAEGIDAGMLPWDVVRSLCSKLAHACRKCIGLAVRLQCERLEHAGNLSREHIGI